MALDLVAAENAIHAWVVAASGLAASRVIWSNYSTVRPDLPYVELEISNLMSVGHKWTRREAADVPATGADIVVRAQGHATARLVLQAFTDQHAGSQAIALLGGVMAALPHYHDALDEAGVGIGSESPVTFVGSVGSILEPRATAGVDLHLAFETVGLVGSITSIELVVSADDAETDASVTLEP